VAETTERRTGATGIVLLTLAAGQFLMILDSSVMNVSIATVAKDVGTTVTGIQTAITLYTLVMASLMITGGKIGQILGFKRAFAIGCVIYGCGSFTTAISQSLGVLMFGWSFLEGVGATLILPAIVALVASNFGQAERPRAYGLVASDRPSCVAHRWPSAGPPQRRRPRPQPGRSDPSVRARPRLNHRTAPSSVHSQLPSAAERLATGRAARERVKRSELAGWERMGAKDPVALISAQNAIRLPELLPIRHSRMAMSPWAFYRGAAAVMAADLASRADTGLTVQLCGDAHVLNFGLWATPERQLSFDLRDFDETLPGPFEWDLSRLVASIVVLAREYGLTTNVAERAVARCLRTYRDRIAHYATARQLDIWYDLITAQQFIALFAPEEQEQVSSHIERKARRRTSAGAARKLTERVAGHLRIIEDPPLRVRLRAGEPALADEVFEAYRASLPEYRRHLLDRFAFVDAARQVVGVGSVGMRVFLVLLEGRDGADPLFLQIKQAGSSVYEAYRGRSRHPNHGERVVVGKRLIQSATDIFAGFTSVAGNDFYVRQFRDMKVIPNGELIAPRLAQFATACGKALARAHARTGDPIAIAAYIGKGRAFDQALREFAVSYADQTARDHQQLSDAIAGGAVEASIEE
jgi:uncharacterized protein (DUF2252 family)